MTRFTLWGLYQYDPTLFDGVEVPNGLEKESVIDSIIERSGDLYLYYQVPERAKSQITHWFKTHYLGFQRMIDALLSEYNPIENYDRYEDGWENKDTTSNNTIKNTSNSTANSTSGTITSNTAGGSDKVEYETDNYLENKVSAFDSGDYEPHDDSTDKKDEDTTTTYGRTDNGTSNTTASDSANITANTTDDIIANDKVKHGLHVHGNIGVTTNQQMIEAELKLRVYNIYDVIATMFENDILVQLY